MRKRIMFVTDVPDERLIQAVEEHDFEVTIAGNTAAIARSPTMAVPDLLVLDLSDTEQTIQLLKEIRASSRWNRTSVMVAAEWGSGQATLSLSNGADAFEPKPISPARLMASIDNLLRPRLVMTANAGEE